MAANQQTINNDSYENSTNDPASFNGLFDIKQSQENNAALLILL